MPTTLDLKLLPKVKALIARVGIATTLTPGDGTFDPATSTVGAAATAPHIVTATPPLSYRMHVVDGDVIRHGDTHIYFAGSGYAHTPKVGWKVTTGGRTWNVVGVSDLRSGEQTAAWELQLRR